MYVFWYKHSSSSFWSPAGLITFFSFLVLGSIPLLSYVAFLIAHGGDVNEKINSDEFCLWFWTIPFLPSPLWVAPSPRVLSVCLSVSCLFG